MVKICFKKELKNDSRISYTSAKQDLITLKINWTTCQNREFNISSLLR